MLLHFFQNERYRVNLMQNAIQEFFSIVKDILVSEQTLISWMKWEIAEIESNVSDWTEWVQLCLKT